MSAQSALTYAAFICDGNADAATLQAVCKAGGVEVSAGLAKVYAQMLAKKNLGDLLNNVSFGGCAGGAAAGGAAAGAAAPAAKAAEPEEEEGDDDMGFGLFD